MGSLSSGPCSFSAETMFPSPHRVLRGGAWSWRKAFAVGEIAEQVWPWIFAKMQSCIGVRVQEEGNPHSHLLRGAVWVD